MLAHAYARPPLLPSVLTFFFLFLRWFCLCRVLAIQGYTLDGLDELQSASRIVCVVEAPVREEHGTVNNGVRLGSGRFACG